MSLASKAYAYATKASAGMARLVPDERSDPLRFAGGELGRAHDRVDGLDKVTGRATYTADHTPERMAHAVLVGSTIAKGRVTGIDLSEAADCSGVIFILTHENTPKRKQTATFATLRGPLSASGTSVPVLNTDRIEWRGQPVAVVVAETLEQAREAANWLRVSYVEEEDAKFCLASARDEAFTPSNTGFEESETHVGDADAALSRAGRRVDHLYTTPYVNHCAMEPHATLAEWQGDRLIVHDTTQYPTGLRDMLASKFGLSKDKIEVVAPFIGGGFGGKAAGWPHVDLAVSAARLVNRPVRLELSRPDTFTATGGRSMTEQRLALGASEDGRLTALIHEALGMCTRDVFAEYAIAPSRHLYAASAIRLGMKVARLDRIQNSFMRAPGDVTGSFALESAMDELAWTCGVDPIELRIRNEPACNPTKGTDFTSRHLVECMRTGAEAFGWHERAERPGMMRDGRWLVGYGMAAAIYPIQQFSSSVAMTLRADGGVLVETATSEMGVGTATSQRQATAERLGVSFDQVRFVHGNSRLPASTTPGGSATTVTLAKAIWKGADKLLDHLLTATRNTGSPLAKAKAGDCEMRDGGVFLKLLPSVGESYETLIARTGGELRVEVSGGYSMRGTKHSAQAHGAHFCEVRVDPDTFEARVLRWTSVIDGGRILNQKLAESQIMGGVIMGIGMALMEETKTDLRDGCLTNSNLAEYHVPTNADAPAIEVRFLDHPDPLTPLGAKGIGELGIVGAPAAVANAIYHATGARIRSLPITLDKILSDVKI